MKKLTICYALGMILLITSCATDKVASGGFLQKRKYQKGFFMRSPFKKFDKTSSEQNLMVEEVKKSNVEEEYIGRLHETKQSPNQSIGQETLPVPKKEISKNKKLNHGIEKLTEHLGTKEVTRAHKTSNVGNRLHSIALPNPYVNGGDSQVVALLLVILVGVIGIHRFYLGYVGIGILQIITLGGCGVWTLIDLIRIVTGDLQPKYGDYSETL